MRAYVVAAIVLGMLAACSPEPGSSTRASRPGVAGATTVASQQAPVARATPGIAALPDRGALLEYRRLQAAQVRGATTWHPVQLSEAHALRAVVGGEMVVQAPDGRPIRLRYARHVEHPDGNWTWVGREPGAMPGTEAIITFGEKAVFGTIPDGDGPPLRLTTSAGRTWLVETDAAALARLHQGRPPAPDFRVPPMLGGIPSNNTRSIAAAPSTATNTIAATNVIDLVLGYTSGFATRLGGQSQAVTRLTFTVDVANQAFTNSKVDARIRVVRTLQVAYPDATANDQALYALTGVECTEVDGGLSCQYVGPPASLQPLHVAREQFGGDLVSLVRNFSDDNLGCGVAWINGAGQRGMVHSSEATGFSVVSDSSGSRFPDPDTDHICSDEALAHELGHNMGSAHDEDTADGDDNTLQQQEYGAYAFSFGYRTGPGSGDFFTVMAYPDMRTAPPFQVGYRVFSNPAISVCGGFPCGVANRADNARSLRLTLPVVAGFRATVVSDPGGAEMGDFDGDGKSDVLWRNIVNGQNAIWRSANSATRLAISPIANLSWKVVGLRDFNGDGKDDVLWRNSGNGQNAIWRSGNAATPQAIQPLANLDWKIVGTGDFNGDGKGDVLWRNDANGQNAIWRSGNAATPQAIQPLANLDWKIVGTGDFNGDGKDDVLWRNSVNGQNAIWRSGNAATPQAISPVANLDWKIVGTGDFNGDGKDDVLWRNSVNGQNAIWRSGNAATPQAISPVASLAWKIVGAGDFNGDARDDVLWRNDVNGQNAIWRSGNAATRQAISPIANLDWQVAG